MTNEINLFFEAYRQAYLEFNLQKILTFFAEPFMVSSPRGARTANNIDEMTSLLSKLLNRYRNLGIHTGCINNLKTNEYKSNHIQVEANWTIGDTKNNSLITFDCTYILIQSDNILKILFVMAHDEDKKLRALEIERGLKNN